VAVNAFFNFGKSLQKNPLVAVVSSMNSGFLKILFENLDVDCRFICGGQCLLYFGNYFGKIQL